jgi:hypothetical protein
MMQLAVTLLGNAISNSLSL